MKTSKIFYLSVIISALVFISCSKLLDEKTFTSLGPSNFYNTTEDAEALLNGVYANSQGYRDVARDLLTFGEMTTDIMIERAGAINAYTQPVEDFKWTSTHQWLQEMWSRYYSAIFRANTVLDNVPEIDMDKNRRDQIVAEARFLRVLNYYYLYDLFGPVPIIETSETSVTDRPTRATKEEMVSFIENELQVVSAILPKTQTQYGRATSGAALGYLCKFYLNNKEWQNAAESALKIMNTNVYTIYNKSNRIDLFALANKKMNEFIWVRCFPNTPTSDLGNTYLSHAAPPAYKFLYPPKTNFAAQFKVRTDFINTFDPKDQRLGAFIFQYLNNSGKTVVLGQDDVRSFKYPEDPNGVGDVSGNDFPLLRYADILLSRSEALNELNGPSQESIDLVNVIRSAAGVDSINLADFSGKQQLRDFILAERGREFHTEGLRRQDLIRQGKFIEMAKSRGKVASDYQVLFPIPQAEVDKNENLVQNDGY